MEFQDIAVARYRTWDGKEIPVVRSSAGDGGNEATDDVCEPLSPSKRRSSRTKTNAVDSPAVKEGWLLSEEQGARKREMASSLGPKATSTDEPVATSSTKSANVTAIKAGKLLFEEQGARKRGKLTNSAPSLSPTSTDDQVAGSGPKSMNSTRKLLPEEQGSRKRGKASFSAPNLSPTTADDPIAISDTEDDATPQASSSDPQQSLQSATSVTRSAGEKGSGKHERSSTRGSASTSASLDNCSDKQGQHQESKLLAARDLPRMSMVMTPFGPGIFLRLRETYGVCISRELFRFKSQQFLTFLLLFVSRLALF